MSTQLLLVLMADPAPVQKKEEKAAKEERKSERPEEEGDDEAGVESQAGDEEGKSTSPSGLDSPSRPPSPFLVPTVAQDGERLDKARQLLQEAIRRSQAQGPAPAPGGLRPFPGMKVDKYFGTKLPPVCASLGCYVTDDGKRFYCVNPACQKHKKRETKHTRKGNPAKAHFVYFRCPRCESRSLEMHVLSNRYVCRACKYSWQR